MRPIFFDYSLYEAGARNYEELVSHAFCILLGLANIAAPTVHALYSFRSEFGRALCAANTLGHEDEPLLRRSLKELLMVDVISKAHAHIIYHGIIDSADPKEVFYDAFEKNDAE